MEGDSTRRRALVLGGSCPMALHLVPCLLAQKIRPILSYRTDAAKERILTGLEDQGAELDLVRLDFNDPETLCHLVNFLDHRLTYLVDFAHSDFESLVAGAKDNAVSDYFAANLSFRAAVLKRVARTMLAKRYGRLVFISSTAAARPNPGQGFYAAAKLGAEALYRNLGLEMSAKGITTAILRPGYVAVGRGERFLTAHPEHARNLEKSGHIIAVKDLLDALMFLLLTPSTATNTAVLSMDGGMTVGK